MNRPGSGSVFAAGTGSWSTLHDWLYYDPVIVLAGVAALVPMLFMRRLPRPGDRGARSRGDGAAPGLPARDVHHPGAALLALAIAGLGHRIVRLLLNGERQRVVRRAAVAALTGACSAWSARAGRQATPPP